ncbi:phosphoserine transaminase [Granulibacter bethesdensis]|uniref:phosphoserine transaminase n=1 Tax=Granulibacter bethesdensis TaxID=364410 RepID=UPI00090A5310|nr:phosphoserine transaminase [Granulibacter bethesdensis]APH59168.1 Phosphoserine aminotransferase [Granulibacter bethesdensis]
MALSAKPVQRPANPQFSSGPCTKHPGWSLAALDVSLLGRNHRMVAPKARLNEVIRRSHALLELPADWIVGLVPASDTGAVEMALWSMLGARGVDVLAWETFTEMWAVDVATQLNLTDYRLFRAPWGELPDLSAVDALNRDIVFAWNGTAAGVKMPDADWIPADRKGLTICDATSAAFAMELPWDKLDVVTWSWQKVLGGEAAHGMIALSPRAVDRLLTFQPQRPLPKIFRLTEPGPEGKPRLIDSLFQGETINTPSMLCVEDAMSAIAWAERIGGVKALIARSQANFAAVERWVARTPWIDFLAKNPATRATTSITLRPVSPWFTALDVVEQAAAVKRMVSLIEAEGAGFDFANYRDAPSGFRIWGGATVETADVECLLGWIDWAYAQVQSEYVQKAA